MPESAADKPDIEKSDGPNSSDSTVDLAELRSLLVGPEQGQLRALQSRLDDPKTYAREVSHILPEAIALRGHDSVLTKALAPTVEQSITSLVRRNPRPLSEALFPVMGPAIRKSIRHALSSMLDSFNHALEQSLSWRSLRWRVEAWRTGKPFSEVVLVHTLLYRVEQAFLIQRSSGLLLQHVMAPSAPAQDADMVSGMLTAIRDFVRDSFGAQEHDSLEALQVGDLSVWTEQGPQAILAAVVRGNAPQDLRLSLQDALESIHLQYADELESFSGDVKAFESAQPILEACLQTQYRHAVKKSSYRAVWGFAALLLVVLGIWGYFSLRDRARWNRYLDRIRNEPGIVIVSTGNKGGKHTISGLRDPLAPDPDALAAESGLSREEVDGRWELYQALDSRLVLRRAMQILDPPSSAKLAYENGVLTASGAASQQWLNESRRLARLIPGIVRYQDTGLENADLNELRARIEATNLHFTKGTKDLVGGQREALSALLRDLSQLDGVAAGSGRRARLTVVGHTDSDGSPDTNVTLSLARAEAVAALVPSRNYQALEISTVGAGSSQPLTSGTTEQDKRKNRCVSFRVELPGKPGR